MCCNCCADKDTWEKTHEQKCLEDQKARAFAKVAAEAEEVDAEAGGVDVRSELDANAVPSDEEEVGASDVSDDEYYSEQEDDN